jgi:PHD and RING finger domain-containing protein 1
MSKDSKLPKENFKPPLKKLKIEKHEFTDNDDESDSESISSLVSVGSSKESSSNNDVCPICLCSFKNQESGKPNVCEHKFCLECLLEWSKVS